MYECHSRWCLRSYFDAGANQAQWPFPEVDCFPSVNANTTLSWKHTIGTHLGVTLHVWTYSMLIPARTCAVQLFCATFIVLVVSFWSALSYINRFLLVSQNFLYDVCEVSINLNKSSQQHLTCTFWRMCPTFSRCCKIAKSKVNNFYDIISILWYMSNVFMRSGCS